MSFARGLLAQVEVVHALALRETRTRFGAHHLGYLWAILEPVLWILTFLLLFKVAGRSASRGMDIFGFLATGLVPFQLFSSSANRVAEAINANKGLLFYPHIQPLDLVFARSVLEVVTSAAVFMALMGANVLYHQHLDIDEPLLIVCGFGFASLFGTGIGLVFCGLGQFSAVADRARGPLLRPFFWISGVFFTAQELPSVARDVLLYNPLLHVTELVRDGWYPSYTAVHVDLGYVLAWILALGFAGLSLERVIRRRIEVT